MTEGAPAIFVALEASGIGAAIRQSRWLYMVSNIGHIVALTFFAGAIAVMDVRLIGGFAGTPPARIIGQARRVAIAALAALALTGAALFTAEASHVVLNRAFQLKTALIALGLANVAWVEFVILPQIKRLQDSSPMPSGARTAAIVSIATWLGVAICGRAIAYF